MFSISYGQKQLSLDTTYYENDATYIRSGIFYNGFRLKNKEKNYTNTFVLINSYGVGITKFIEFNVAGVVVPISGANGSGIAPMILLIPRCGFDLGYLHHFSASVMISPFAFSSDKGHYANKQLAYTFGTPKNNIGLIYSKDDFTKFGSEFLYFQYSFGVFKWLKIGAEQILIDNSYYDNFNLYNRDNKKDFLTLANFVFRFKFKNKATLSIGFLTDYSQFTNNTFGYLSATIRLNKRTTK